MEMTDLSSIRPSKMTRVILNVVEECPEEEGNDTDGGIEIVVNPSDQADDSCESKDLTDRRSECFMW